MSSNTPFITIDQHQKQVKLEEQHKRKAERDAAKIIKAEQQAEKLRIKKEKEELRLRELELKPKKKQNSSTLTGKKRLPVNKDNSDIVLVGDPIQQSDVGITNVSDTLDNTKISEITSYPNPNDFDSITTKLSKMINVDNIVINYEPIYRILKFQNENVISKIIHIADIHIRLSTLHDEYNEVFELLYSELRNIKKNSPNTLICLCGDLLHSKDELKPNTIIQTWNFIKNLSDIFPLIIITGNHDTIELNNNKIDSITAILKDRPIDNTYYLLNSGVYIYNNIVFGVSSIIDKFMMSRNIVDNVIKMNSDPFIGNQYLDQDIKYIGLYHGSVDGCIINEYGTRLRGTKKVSDFACPLTGHTYDYILLGDIHKFQYLDKQKRVAYSSSLISQNFTETDDYHGFLEWNILNGTSSYHKIKNNYAYHKININTLYNTNQLDVNSSVMFNEQSIHNIFNKIKSGFVRIEFEEVLSSKINRELLKTQINALYPLIIISWQIIFNKNNHKDINNVIDVESSNSVLELNNIININKDDDKDGQLKTSTDILDNEIANNNNTEYMNDLIRRYMKNNFYNITETTIERVLEYLNKIIIDNKSVEDDIEYVKSDWKILWLSFDNMYGYGPNNVIDFTKYPINEIVGIFGENAIGKSSIIDILTFMLYSRSARDDSPMNPKDIVNVSTNKASGIIIIESNNIKYLIKRNCIRAYHATSSKYFLKTSLFTYKMIETDDILLKDTFKLHNKIYILKSLTEENRLCTDDILIPIIGTYDNFITTSVLLQGNHKSFKNKTNVQKKDFLCQILKIDYFKKCETVINDKFKSLKIQLNTLKNIYNNFNNTKSISDLKNNINTIDLQLNEYINKLSQLENEVVVNYDNIQQLSTSIINIDQIVYNINIDEEQQKLKIIDNIIDENNTKIMLLTNNINELKILIHNLDIDEKQQQTITFNYEQYNNNFKINHDIVMKQINDLFNLKQTYVINKIDKNLTIETLNIFIDEHINNNNILTSKHSEINNIYNTINNIIDSMHIIDPNIVITDNNTLMENKNMIDNITNELSNYNKEQYILSDRIINLNKMIDALNLIKFRDTIVKEYNDFVIFKKNKQDKLMNDINTIMFKQQIFITYIDEDIKLDELLSKQIKLLSILNNNNSNVAILYEKHKDLLIMDDNERLLIDPIYISSISQHKYILDEQLKKYYNRKYNYNFITCQYDDTVINTLISNKNNLLSFFNCHNTKLFLNNKERITDDYLKMMNDSKSLIYESLNNITDNIQNVEHNIEQVTSINNIKDFVITIKSSLNNIFNDQNENHILNKYNELLLFEKEYDHNKILFKNILTDINTFYCIDKINNKINKIKEELFNIEQSEFLINKLNQLLATFERTENELTVELDEIQNNILIINSNNEKNEQIQNNNNRINDLKYEYDNIDVISPVFNQSIQTIFDNYNSQQRLFMDYNDELNPITIKNNELLNNISNLNNKIDIINKNIDAYYNIKHDIETNNVLQDKIELLYDTVDNIKNDLFDITINDIDDIKSLLDLFKNNIDYNNDLIDKARCNIDIIVSNNNILSDIKNIDDQINHCKKQLDDINDPNNINILNFKNLQEKILLNGKYNANINAISDEINNIKQLIDTNTSKRIQIYNNIKLYNDSKIHIDHNNDINKKILLLKDQIKLITQDIKDITNKNLVCMNDKDNLSKLICNIEKTNSELDVIKTEINIYELLSKLTSRDGVQLFLLSESLQNITNKVNNILEPFINKTIKMSMNGDTIDLTIISKNGSVINTISGMESFMLDLVFKIIIGQISVIPKSNIIFMDESISVLDSNRMASIEELFAFLRQYYNTVFLITHMKQVNNHINHSLDIVRYNGHSLIFNIHINKYINETIDNDNDNDVNKSLDQSNITTNIDDANYNNDNIIKKPRRKKHIKNDPNMPIDF